MDTGAVKERAVETKPKLIEFEVLIKETASIALNGFLTFGFKILKLNLNRSFFFNRRYIVVISQHTSRILFFFLLHYFAFSQFSLRLYADVPKLSPEPAGAQIFSPEKTRRSPTEMYNNVGPQAGVTIPPTNSQPNPFGNAFYGAGSGLIRGGLGAYGEKILGSSSEYVQSNISRYFSDPQYYFQVNDHYVRNKLKVVLFPFLHRGHWTRITEPVGGRLSYKPPIYDINAPDLYIPFMAFGTYVVLAGFSLGLQGKFSPEALNWLFIKGLLGWFLQVALLKVTLLSLGSGEAPLLDIVAYAGYTFTGMCLAVLGKIIWGYSYYALMPWTCLCMGIFLVKTMKRVLFAEVRSYDSSKHHYLLLFIALAQFPLFTWLGNISVNWLI